MSRQTIQLCYILLLTAILTYYFELAESEDNQVANNNLVKREKVQDETLHHLRYVLNDFLRENRNKREIKKRKKHLKKHKKAKKQEAKWEKWSNWSTCSVSCGKGRHIRWRNCKENCNDIITEMEEKTCQLPACPNKLFGLIKL